MNEKPFSIPKRAVWQAWQQVKANKGSHGVDRESISDFEKDLKRNLYRIWNRLSSGSYFPPPVRRVEIPKKDGRMRVLGVPTVSDRIAQATILQYIQPLLEPIFHKDSYGYRPGKSAHDALEITKKRCWKYRFLVEFDVVGLFDNLSHELLMKAMRKHCSNAWVLLYVERWLKADRQQADGKLIAGTKGVPQGSLVGPVLSNLFMHYAFDLWMQRAHPNLPFCRYADDAIAHARTLQEAQHLMKTIAQRFQEVGLQVHPDKTKIVCCTQRKLFTEGIAREFDFLGYRFRQREAFSMSLGKRFSTFAPAPSPKALKKIREVVRDGWKLKSRLQVDLQEIAQFVNPIIRGWFQYYHRFRKEEMRAISKYIDMHLMKWAQRKYKKLRYRTMRAKRWLGRICSQNQELFAHWKYYAVS